MKEPIRSRRQYLWPMAVAALIFVASSRSQLAEPGLPSIDKVAHFSVYGLLATLMVRLGRGAKAAWVSITLASLYGMSDEWHQSFTPGRAVELLDWIADTLGAATAVILLYPLDDLPTLARKPCWA